jgi:hypothetical protein
VRVALFPAECFFGDDHEQGAYRGCGHCYRRPNNLLPRSNRLRPGDLVRTVGPEGNESRLSVPHLDYKQSFERLQHRSYKSGSVDRRFRLQSAIVVVLTGKPECMARRFAASEM